MKNCIVIILIAFFTCTKGNAQNRAGIYQGGLCYQEGSLSCGIWMIHSDSSFQFCRIVNKHITTYGRGRWTFVDSNFTFNFQNAVDLVKYYDSKTTYISSLAANIDSVRIFGRVSFSDGRPVKNAIISVMSIGTANTQNDGGFELKVRLQPLTNKVLRMVTNDFLYNITLMLNEHANSHEIAIQLPSDSGGVYQPFFMSTITIRHSAKKLHSLGEIVKARISKRELIALLNQCKQNQPWLGREIGDLSHAIMNMK